MEKPQSVWRFLLEIGALVGFVIVMYFVFDFFRTRTRPATQGEATNKVISPSAGSNIESQIDVDSSPYPPPYHPPGSQGSSPALPDIIHDLYSKSSLFVGTKAATLAKGSIWLVQSDSQPEALVDFGDVTANYGWNYDGTKILFGRGQYKTSGDLAKSTELWVYDLNTEKAYRLIDSTKVWSAVWSPVDDRVAYSEYGDTPTAYVVSQEGEILHKRDEYLFSDLAWSPDGSAIALSYNGPDMVDFDTRFSVLAIWWLEKDELQLLSNAKREAHYFPIWLMDGGRILFTRIFGPGSEEDESGLYIADIHTLQITQLNNGPKFIVNRMMRSPRSDTLVFWMDNQVYVMELGKEPISIGRGSDPVWYLDGKTIFYVDDNGIYQIASLDLPVEDQIIGGNFSASTIHLQPGIFFQKDTDQ